MAIECNFSAAADSWFTPAEVVVCCCCCCWVPMDLRWIPRQLSQLATSAAQDEYGWISNTQDDAAILPGSRKGCLVLLTLMTFPMRRRHLRKKNAISWYPVVYFQLIHHSKNSSPFLLPNERDAWSINGYIHGPNDQCHLKSVGISGYAASCSYIG